MCGRYTLSELPEWSELHIRVPDELLLRPRYNAAPGAPQLVVTREPDGQLTTTRGAWRRPSPSRSCSSFETPRGSCAPRSR